VNEKSWADDQILADVVSILQGEHDFLANMANRAAILFLNLPDINWAGFYLLKGTDLVLGPFQGKPACGRIGPGRGACGDAADRREVIVVPDVHAFPGHIACDAASRSEIVIPLIHNHRVIGLLDVDSPSIGRFEAADQILLQAVVDSLLNASDLGTWFLPAHVNIHRPGTG
jgi:L-methionine (R)-S-oxide reductase